MVSDAFGLLLEELAKLLKIKELHADANNSCLIKFQKGPSIQLELRHSGDFLVMGCDLGIVPPGRYRENIFREALKANGLPPPRSGDFAYSRRTDKLVLTKELSLVQLTGEQVFNHLVPFFKKAKEWQQALAKEEIPIPPPSVEAAKAGGGMFGLGTQRK